MSKLTMAHIAIAVKSLADTIPKAEKIFGVKASAPEIVPEQKVRLQFLEVGGVRLEFLEPTHDDSPISAFIAKRGGGIHHLAFNVDDLANKLKMLAADGVPLINDRPQAGAEGCQVAFLHPKALDGVLVEFIEGTH
jgi:methylmalonyl-CoA/ethylmalonyl-CoA epimerase